ncbi:MAG: chromosome partitioning protein ParA [Ramlibacter sp.]|nr:chromosome partitioning protein ParA [Ramlibacter sp.]
MSPARLFQIFLVRLLPLLVLGLLGVRALAQSDPPARVARLNHLEGAAVFSPAGDNEWTDALLNRPLTRGDRVWTDKASRAEVQVGSSAVRMDGQTHLEILALDDRSAQLSVTQGTVYVRVRSLPEGENFEIDTPNLAYRAAYPGDYRIDVNASTGTTRVTIHSGTGAVYGEDGQVLALGGGQQITFRARDLSQMAAQESPPQDNFDRWAADRNRREDQSVSARYVPREVVGYQQLDAHGQWMQDATYGPVWFPQGLAANWAPYRNGHWEWISPWGWTWIDAAAWGFAPFHYGRWAMIDSRWAWVPGRIALKPVYSPALVAFVGAGNGGLGWSVSLGGGRPAVAWFPLAPGEAWQPGYPASPLYMSNVNGNVRVLANAAYAHQRNPEALTSISAEDLHRGRPMRAGWLRIAANTLANAQVLPPPPRPEHSAPADRKPAPATRTPPPAPPKVQVAAAPAAATSRVRVPTQAQEQAPSTEPARAVRAAKAAAPAKPDPLKLAAVAPKPVPPVKAAQMAVAPTGPTVPATASEQAKAAAQARRAEQKLAEAARADQAKADEARREKLARRAEQSRRDLVAKRAEQTRREQVARQAELAKREVAKREQARREQVAVARRAEQAQRDEQARRAEQLKREAVARRDEQLRREAHARQVELARRAADREAQALQEQREQREEMQARREAQEREQAQRAAWARQQQALGEQWRRDQAWEQQQRERARQRPDLRDDRRSRLPEPQRGIPIISGPWS